MEKLLKLIIHYSLFIIIFLLPLFFLPATQEFFITNKFYLLGFAALFLLLISNIQYLISKKISWVSLPLDTPIILFILTTILSVIISSPNKVQAVLNPSFGPLTFFSLAIFYFYLSRNLNKQTLLKLILNISCLLLSIITIVFFFQPFKNFNLDQNLQFLKNPLFTPIGSQIDLAIFLGFFVIHELTQIIKDTQNNANKNGSIINYSLLIINLLALSLTLYQIFKPENQTNFLLPPWRLSWYAAVEILKNPLIALFGVGVDNFTSIFTQVKDIIYNQSNLWQINSFVLSRSALLHILTETGLFGLSSFLILILTLVKNANKEEDKTSLFIILYSLLIIVLLPPSLISWFLFFVILGLVASEKKATAVEKSYEMGEIMPLFLGLAVVWLGLIGFSGYLLGRSYAAEVYFKKSLDGFTKNDAKIVYENMRQAIILNPYNEQVRINFSQLNLLIANNIASKPQKNNEKPQLSEQDRQNISQAIQSAIAEAKAAVSLNPQKAANWINLGEIYRNIINTAQGADTWTISAYQRAITLDPQNPTYRLNLGGLYYSLGSYEDAKNMFQQAVILKPDWPNAYYNLAWASYQKKDYQQAVNAMEGALRLLDPVKNKDDYNKAKKELEDFKQKVAAEQSEQSTSEKTEQEKPPTNENLNLPTPIPTTSSQKIELPKEASPEAK